MSYINRDPGGDDCNLGVGELQKISHWLLVTHSNSIRYIYIVSLVVR